jgi:hypothetical protein
MRGVKHHDTPILHQPSSVRHEQLCPAMSKSLDKLYVLWRHTNNTRTKYQIRVNRVARDGFGVMKKEMGMK